MRTAQCFAFRTNTLPRIFWIKKPLFAYSRGKSRNKGDPFAKGLRIDFMLDAEISIDQNATSGAALAACVGSMNAFQGERLGVSQVNPEADWSSLILRVREARDEAAFAALFTHFAPRIKGFLMKSGATASLAEECAQDVMATLWNKSHLYDPDRATVSTWIFTIARNRRIDALRKARRPEPEDLPWGPEAEPDQQSALELQQETDRLGEALLLLPEKQRELIERAYYGDLSHTEIAAETGLPLGTIKSRIRLALERLRHHMS